MAVYTTEVRTICEQFAGMTDRSGYGDIDKAISGSWDQIFSSEWDTYDPAYKPVLCRKILKHYWMREIGLETVGLFLHFLNTRMGEIMPYYNALYKSATLEFNPLHDYEMSHTSTKTTNGESSNETVTEENHTRSSTETTTSESEARLTESSQSSSQSSASSNLSSDDNSTTTSTNQNINKFNDTPQGMLENVISGAYLTNATVDDGTSKVDETSGRTQTASEQSSGGTNRDSETDSTKSSSGSRNSQDTNATKGKVEGATSANTTEEYTLKVVGKTGGASYAKLLTEFRDTLLNIDAMIINELSDLFMGLWA